MYKAYFTTEPSQVSYIPQADGTAEVWLRRNIREEQTEDGVQWSADEVQFNTCLTEEEVLAQADKYFLEEPETTIEDVVEALNILTDLIIGEEE